LKALRFNEERTTQAAAYLLKLRGGRMSYMKLVKLLYLADREALLTRGRPITFDSFVAMDHGPVPSKTLDLAKKKNQFPTHVWGRHISHPDSADEITLFADPGVGKLSENQMSILDSLFAAWGAKSRWDVRDFAHELPEYKANTPQSRKTLPISIRDILLAEGFSDSDVVAVECALEAETDMQNLTA
jgi:uncharacterized phage-associated protein